MPELPEVETVRTILERNIINKTIEDVVIKYDFPEHIELICDRLAGDWAYWEDYANEEALAWYYNKKADALEIEIE